VSHIDFAAGFAEAVCSEPIYFGLARFMSANGRTAMECDGADQLSGFRAHSVNAIEESDRLLRVQELTVVNTARLPTADGPDYRLVTATGLSSLFARRGARNVVHPRVAAPR